MHCCIGHIPVASKASSSNDHSHPPSPTHRYVISEIPLENLWWNPYINFSITSVATQIFLPYINNVCTTTLYTIAHYCIVATVITKNYSTISHHCCVLLIFKYRAAHLMLLKAIVRPKYGKAAVVSSGSRLTPDLCQSSINTKVYRRH